MSVEFQSTCKDCSKEFGYSEASIAAGNVRGLSRPERCPACRRLHARESRYIGAPQIPLKPICKRKPDDELTGGRLGKITHPPREHIKIKTQGKFQETGTGLEFGITDDDICRLIEATATHQVTVVVGPTGSGKSTFLPYRLMIPPPGVEPDIFTRYGQIVITQPRIQATRSIARFVGEDMHGSSIGAGYDVGFRHSGAPASDWRNKLVYITDGTLINWIVDGQLGNLSVIMIDEAHERSLNIDLILGLLKQQLPRYPRLRLIIASATINAALFQNYYGGPDKVALLNFKGLKQHRVDAYFPFHDDALRNDRNVPRHMAKKIHDLLMAIASGKKSEGDILGFLPGAKEIEDCAETLRGRIRETPELKERGVQVYPLYTQLSQKDQDLALAAKKGTICQRTLTFLNKYAAGSSQDRIAALLLDTKSATEAAEMIEKELPSGNPDGWQINCWLNKSTEPTSFPRQILVTTHELFQHLQQSDSYTVIKDRRVIISTNVAETSLTVDGIVYVVDSGLIKESSWKAEESANKLIPIFHSRAGSRQRAGRCGRVMDGEAHMLYTDDQFEDETVFTPHTLPEIMRSSLEQVALKAAAAGVEDIASFDWIQRPPEEELERAPALLKTIGAMDEDNDLTGYGLELQTITTDVPIAALLTTADQFACGVEMATIAALSSMRLKGGLLTWDPQWDLASRQAVEEVHQRMRGFCRDDLEYYFKIYSIWSETADPETRTALCRQFLINDSELENRVAPELSKFLELFSIGKKSEEQRTINYDLLDRLRIVLAVTMPESFIYETWEDGSLQTVNGKSPGMEIAIADGSVFSQQTPPFFLAFSRRIIQPPQQEEKLILGLIVQIEKEWMNWRNLETLDLAKKIARTVADNTSSEHSGKARQRLFVDVKFPLGACFGIKTDDNGRIYPGEKVADPDPVYPVTTPEKSASDEWTDQEGLDDVDPRAGWDDKKDETIPYDDESLDADITESVQADEIEDPEWPDDQFEAPEWEGLIKTRDIAASEARRIEYQWLTINSSVGFGVVTGHEIVDDVPKVLFQGQSASKTDSPYSGSLKTGDIIQVEVLGVHTLERGEKGLRVKPINSDQTYLVDARDLTFSGRWCFADCFEPGMKIKMMAEKRGGAIRLTRLPVIEKKLHQFIKATSKDSPIQCRLLEKRGRSLTFIISDLEKLEKDVEGAQVYANWDNKNNYDEGKTYSLYIDSSYGQAYQSMPIKPDNLDAFISENKKPHGIFWDSWRSRLYIKKPMLYEFYKEMAGLSNDSAYRAAIAGLYRNSNKIPLQLNDYFSALEKIGKDYTEEENDELPEYSPGEELEGKVVTVYDNMVLVALDRGGRGSVDNSHLSWSRIIDPREVVYPGQRVQVRVISYEEKGDKTYIRLSMLDDIFQKRKTGWIPGNKIGLLIGKGGETIKRISAESACKIIINQQEKGRIDLEAENPAYIDKAIKLIRKMIPELTIEDPVQATVINSNSPGQ
jgi:HrpA-like RNA helicase